MASPLSSSRSSSGWFAARAPDRNKTSTNCLSLGLIFGMATRFSRPFQQKLHPGVGIRVPVTLEMQFRDAPQAQARSQFVTQIMPRTLQRGHGLVLFAFIPTNHYFDVGIARVGAYVHLRHIHGQQPGVLQLESDDFGQLLADRFGNPYCPPFIHGSGSTGPRACPDRKSVV